MRYFIQERVGLPAKLIMMNEDRTITFVEEIFIESTQATFPIAYARVESLEKPEIKPKKGSTKPRKGAKKVHVKQNIQEKSKEISGVTTAMKVREMWEAGKSDEEIAKELGLGVPAVAYHRRKLGKKVEKGTFVSPKSLGGITAVTTEEGSYFPITDPDDIERIWDVVDSGTRESSEIARMMGRNPLAVRAVLMQPRP